MLHSILMGLACAVIVYAFFPRVKPIPENEWREYTRLRKMSVEELRKAAKDKESVEGGPAREAEPNDVRERDFLKWRRRQREGEH